MAETLERVARATGWRGLILSLLAGALAALGQAPFNLWPIALLGLMLTLLRGAGAGGVASAAKRGFSIGFGFALVAVNWIVEPFLVDAARFGLLAPFGLGAMATGFGLFWALGFAAAAFLVPRAGPARLATLVIAITGIEILRATILTGFPWALLSLMWLETPVYLLARFVGPHGVTLLTLAGLAALIAAIWRKAWVGAGLAGALALTAAALIWGEVRAPLDDAGPIVRIVQPNATQHLKWQPEWRDVFFERHLELSAEPGTHAVTFWPEVAVTFLLQSPDAPYDQISRAVGERPLVLGGQRIEAYQAYNSMLVLDKNGTPTALYDKAHLVPFGEYVPGGAVARALGLRGLAEQLDYGFSSGPGPRLVEVPGGITLLPMICYEAIFPHELRRLAPKRPDLLLHMTNDAWFGRLTGPYQHLAQARARSVEFGLPGVRSANTGISALIDANGRVVDSLPLNVAGIVDGPVPPKRLHATLYWQFGDSPVVIFLIGAAIALGLSARRQSV